MISWSQNIKQPPKLMTPEDEFEVRDRAFPFEDQDDDYIKITPKSVTFIGQRGPVREVGVNGCQIDDIIRFATETIRAFNKKFPCQENISAINNLEDAMFWLNERLRDREKRKVEGLNKA